jgi:bifunctional DNase/RNase
VTTIRIAHAEPRPGRLASGGFHTRGHLVVLADDAGHRAVPIWMEGAGDLASLLERRGGQIIADSVPQELTTRLLGAAGARVTGVDIDVTEADDAELSPEVSVARIELAGPTGTRQVTADLGLALALAAAAGAPVRLADAVLDRLAVSVQGDDLLTPFLGRVPPAAWPPPGRTPPRNKKKKKKL